jgi:hypothetical protein
VKRLRPSLTAALGAAADHDPVLALGQLPRA